MGEGENQPLPVIINTQRPNYFPWILAIAAIIALVIALSKCKGTADNYAQVKAQADTFASKIEQLQSLHSQDSIIKNTLIKQVFDERTRSELQQDSSWIVFSKLQKEYKGLSGRIFNAPIVKQDTGVWVVPNSYKLQCDSCATALQEGSKQLDKLKLEDSLNRVIYQTEIDLRNKYAQDVNTQYDSCVALSVRQNKALYEASKIIKPHGSLIGGVSAQYSPSYGQAGVWLMYKSVGNKYYGIGTGYNSFNKMYFEGRIGITILSKK